MPDNSVATGLSSMDRRNDLDCKPTTSSNISWAEARKDDARHRCPDHYHHPLEIESRQIRSHPCPRQKMRRGCLGCRVLT